MHVPPSSPAMCRAFSLWEVMAVRRGRWLTPSGLRFWGLHTSSPKGCAISGRRRCPPLLAGLHMGLCERGGPRVRLTGKFYCEAACSARWPKATRVPLRAGTTVGRPRRERFRFSLPNPALQRPKRRWGVLILRPDPRRRHLPHPSEAQGKRRPHVDSACRRKCA